ncbi:hypothetical protein FACS189485_14210 [Spirochaetia bacterium]|nr:hypothetical protein FACS189485_14210 [Spirochaetia bacterium]
MKKIFIGIIILINISINCFAQDAAVQDLITNYNDELLLNCYAEGDFTNSGKTEIIGFYQWKDSVKYDYEINKRFCFIINKNETIVKVYDEFPFYVAGAFDERWNLSFMPMEAFGRSIDWRGYSIGRVGDFNGNGRDELYLYSVGGIGFRPAFFEFCPEKNTFRNILEDYEDSFDVELIAVNPIKKQIQFISDGWRYSHEWDESKQMYVGIDNALFEVELPEPKEPSPVNELEQSPSPETPKIAKKQVSREPIPWTRISLLIGLTVVLAIWINVFQKRKKDKK